MRAKIHNVADARGLRASLADCDALAQGASKAIGAMALAARQMLALDAPSLVAVRTLLLEIEQRATDLENHINAEAEGHGVNHIDEAERAAERRLWDQHHALRPTQAKPSDADAAAGDNGGIITH